MSSKISIEANVNEVLYKGEQQFLSAHPDWDRDRVINAALALFLLQNSNDVKTGCAASREYLDSLFGGAA